MSKEAKEYLKKVGTPQIFNEEIICELLQSYADQQVKKAMDSQGFKVCSCGNVITP